MPSSRKGFAFRSSHLPYLAGAGVAVIGVVIAAARYLGASSSADPAASTKDDLAALALPPPLTPMPQGAPAPSSAPVDTETTLTAEIAKIRPMIAETNGPLDRGTATLALWASTHLTWADLKSLNTTSPALFRKDPDQERGRVICIEGTIQEIRAEKNLARRLVVDRSLSTTEAGGGGSERADAGSPILSVDDAEWNVPGGKIFVATLIEPEHAGDRPKLDDARRAKRFAVEALAVKSTGSLVDGDSARFCGVLTGVVQAASEIHLVHRAVGMFDLPENTGAAPHTGSPTP